MEAIMTRTQINKWSGLVPVAMSLAALGIVLAVVTTGWERHLQDEGAAAHLFQLLIAGEIPIVLLFLLTADRARPGPLMRMVAIQAVAIGAALGSLAFFHL
jgi:hypothetical protein